jgi:hypothetical protein
VRAIGRLGERQAERPRDPLLEDLVGTSRVELHGPAGQCRRAQVTEDHVGVGDGGLDATEVVAERPRGGPGAARPDLQRAAGIAPDDGAPTRAHLGQIDGGDA